MLWRYNQLRPYKNQISRILIIKKPQKLESKNVFPIEHPEHEKDYTYTNRAYATTGID